MTGFTLTDEQLSLCADVQKLCAQFGDDYWLAKDKAAQFPHEFHRAFADGGWLANDGRFTPPGM